MRGLPATGHDPDAAAGAPAETPAETLAVSSDPAAPESAEPARPAGSLPKISEFWPEAPQRIEPTPDQYEAPGAGPGRTGGAMHTQIGRGPSRVLGPPPAEPRRRLRTVLAIVAAVVLLGGGIVLSRLVGRPGPDQPASAAPSPAVATAPNLGGGNIPIPLEPAPGATGSPPAVPAAGTVATFELADNTTEIAVRTADLGSNLFRVSTPQGSGVTPRGTVDGTTLRLAVTPTGKVGSAKVDVVLNARVTWSLRLVGGVRRATLDLGRTKVGSVDLAGGADRIDLTLPAQSPPIAIRMSGGVRTWRIETATAVPVRVRLRQGAGEVTLYGKRRAALDRGTTVTSGDFGSNGKGLDVDAVAGSGSMDVTSARP